MVNGIFSGQDRYIVFFFFFFSDPKLPEAVLGSSS